MAKKPFHRSTEAIARQIYSELDREALGFRAAYENLQTRHQERVQELEKQLQRARDALLLCRASRDRAYEIVQARDETITRLNEQVQKTRQISQDRLREWALACEVIRHCVAPEELDAFREFWQENFPLERPFQIR